MCWLIYVYIWWNICKMKVSIHLTFFALFAFLALSFTISKQKKSTENEEVIFSDDKNASNEAN